MNDEQPNNKTQNILNIVLIIGSFSFLLFLAGYLQTSVYYSTLGVRGLFVNFQYYDYVSNGFLLLLGLMFFLLPYILKIYYTISLIKKDNTLIEGLLMKKDLSEQQKATLKQDQAALKKFKIEISDVKFFKKTISYKIYKYFFLISLPILLVLLFFKNYFWASSFIFLDTNLFIAYYLIVCFHKIIKSEHYIFEMLDRAVALFVVLIMFLPMINGFLLAEYRLYSHDFDYYDVTTARGNSIQNAGFIYFNNSNYFFLINNKINIIPEDKIESMVKN